MKKKRKDIKTIVNDAMDKIKREQTMDKYCKYYANNRKEETDVIWNKYRNMTLDKYLKLKEQDKQIIKNYMAERYCPVYHLNESEGKVYIQDRLLWSDILSWGKGKIKWFIEDQKKLMEKCRQSPNCLNDHDINSNYLPF